MPIYEYECSQCGVFERTQRMSDEPLRRCPTCRRKVTKLISSTAFQFKGSGWYVTDYARKGDPAEKTESSDAKAKSAEKSESSDTKAKKDATPKKETPEAKASAA